MSNKADSTEKDGKSTDVGGFLRDFSPSSTFVDYIKRFFYQIIGIYFPGSILFLYIFLFWFVGIGHDPILYYTNHTNFPNGWPNSLGDNTLNLLTVKKDNSDNQVLQIILFIISIVILGEAINAITSKVEVKSGSNI